MTCKYYDCGFCYAPADAKNNSIQGGCFEPEYCATYLMQNKMTEFQPKPQTPEQVADGLRDAFRQAIKDGVMDATPYLKQMTFKSDIEKTEAEIKVLQKKLELLKEIETHKSQPKMEFSFGGKFEVVSYNEMVYYRLEFPDEFYWYKKKYSDDGLLMVAITDGETCRLLEGLWFNDVRKGRYTYVGEEWLPDELEYEEDEMGYNQGWNDCLNEIKRKLND
jgi:hypothetical protein